MKYRKKPVVIEAVQFVREDDPAIHDHFGEFDDWWYSFGKLNIPTLEGVMEASTGDYIIKGVKGEFYPCKPHIFDATYEALTKEEL